MTLFLENVRQAIAAIPHDRECFCSQGKIAHEMGPCICYAARDARIAQAVAHAIEAAASGGPRYPTTQEFYEDAIEMALRAFSALPPDGESGEQK